MHNRGLDSVWLGHKRLNKSVKQKFVDAQGSPRFPRSGEWPDEMRSLGGCYSSWCERRWWKSHTSPNCICGSSLYLHCRVELLSHTYCDWPLQKKSGSDGQGHMLSLKVYLAPDPTEGEALTWIIFWQKPINIVCNHWHSLFPCRRVRHFSPLTCTLGHDLPFLFWKQWIESEAFRNMALISNNTSDQSSQWPRALAPTQKELFRFFLSLTSGCNLVLLNSKDPTVLLASVQRTSPFIIESLMNDLVRQ